MNVKIPKRSKLFYYNKNIDRQVRLAVEKTLKVKVKRVTKMRHGEVNHVYKIISNKGIFLARVFRNKTWPEHDKLPWIEKQLAGHNIPHAKILYHSRKKGFFPYGFMVCEFLDGQNGDQAVRSRRLSLSAAFQKTGALLKKVHGIRTKVFGPLPPKSRTQDFVKFKLAKVKGRIGYLEADKFLPPNLYGKIESQVKTALEPFKKYFMPVLNHGDANRDNVIFTKAGKWVLVDWDNAYSGLWLEDYAELTYWTDWKRPLTQAKRRQEIIRKNFFKGYGKNEFSQEQIAIMEKAFHIMKCTNMLMYYKYNKKSPVEFNKTKSKLLLLLK